MTYKVFDNVLPKEVFDTFAENIKARTTPWYFVGTAYTETGDTGNFSFSNSPDTHSQLGQEVIDIAVQTLDYAGIEIQTLMRTRLGMITKTASNSINEPHIDTDRKHLVGLFYLNDADGDTILYNESIDSFSNYEPTEEFYLKNLKGKVTEMARVQPKANRLLVFDGRYFHSSSTPTTVNRRLTLNFNFK